MFQEKKICMKFTQLMAIAGSILILFACKDNRYELTVINSGSFPDQQITLDGPIRQRLLAESPEDSPEILRLAFAESQNKLDELVSLGENLRHHPSDSLWMVLTSRWEDFRINYSGIHEWPVAREDSLPVAGGADATRKWFELTGKLLKFSGEIRFADALEKLVYEQNAPVLSEKLLKPVFYTHRDDQIFINLIGSSSLTHLHTTGGTVKLIQLTDYPVGNEMVLKCECGDVRFLDVFVRIPSWAVNPTVSYGNVKYVARPGEYCEISRKWKNGDEIRVVLKN
jgi:hypothetical protein